MRHHAFVVEAGAEEGIELVLGWIERELGMRGQNNPDIVLLKYGLFTVEDARQVAEIAASGPVVGETKVLVIAANRAYREAQNALLKLFEEPPPGTYLFLVLPSLGGLLPTLRSRVQVLDSNVGHSMSHISEAAEAFLKASREKRSAIAKRVASGKDEEERREHRDEALAIVNGIEAAAYSVFQNHGGHQVSAMPALLKDVSILRGYLHDRSAPVRMILEHLAIVTPRDLV